MGIKSKQLFKPILAFLLLVLVILSSMEYLDALFNRCGLTAISDSNNRYLQESFDRSVKGFLVLSTIKAGLAVLEGSEVGVGFNLEVGDIVQPIYDFADLAWRTALAGGTVLLLMRLVLQTIQLIDHWFLFAMLLAGLLLFFLSWVLPGLKKSSRILKECLLFITTLTVALYIILPVSISGAAFLSNKITRPLLDEAQQGFESLEQDLSPVTLNKRFFPDKGEDESLWSRLDFKSKLANCKTAILNMARWLKNITSDFAIWTIKFIAGYLFDCIIFPLAFFVVVYILTKSLMRYLFGIQQHQTLREDLDIVLSKYYNQSTSSATKAQRHKEEISI